MKGILKVVKIFLAVLIIVMNLFQLVFKFASFPTNSITIILLLILFLIYLISNFKYPNYKPKIKSKPKAKKLKGTMPMVENNHQKGRKRDKLNKKRK